MFRMDKIIFVVIVNIKIWIDIDNKGDAYRSISNCDRHPTTCPTTRKLTLMIIHKYWKDLLIVQ